MIYGVKQIVNIDMLMHEILQAQGVNKDWEDRTKKEMFYKMGDELYKNLSSFVEFNTDKDRGIKEGVLELAVFPRKEYNDKLKKLKKILDSHALISDGMKKDIFSIFTEDTVSVKNERVYI